MHDYTIYSLIAVFASLGIFFYLGSRASENQTESDFWFSGRNLGYIGSYFTWLASTVAFSYGILYYMQVTAIWGWYVFIGSIMSYLIGLWISIVIAQKSKVDFSNFSTIGKFIELKSESKILGRAVDYMNVLAAFSLVYIEIGLGVSIFSALFEPGTKNIAFEITMFILIAAIPYFYIRLGGFRAIVDSDIWQASLILIGLAAFIGFSFYNFSQPDEVISIGEGFLAPLVDGGDIAVYLAFAYVVNIAAMIPLAGTYQRLTASANPTSRWTAAGIAIVSAALVFAAYVAIAGFYIANGTTISTPADIFAPIAAGGDVARQVIFPLVFVGFVAALISSADSAAMSGILSIFGRSGDPADAPERWRKRRQFAMSFLGLALGVIAGIHIAFSLSGGSFYSIFLTLVFYLFSQLSLAAPIIVAAALLPNRMRNAFSIIVTLAFTWTALTIGFVFGTNLSIRFGLFEDAFAAGSLTGPLATTLFCLAVLTLGTLRLKRRKNDNAPCER